jgi:hypothetical protein
VDFAALSFHHIGIPVEKSKMGENARYSPLYRMYTVDGKNNLGIHIQFHAFDRGSSLDKRVQTNIHVAFKTADITKTLKGQELVFPVYEPFEGYRCAMIIVNNMLLEIIETNLSEERIWNSDETLRKGVLYKSND